MLILKKSAEDKILCLGQCGPNIFCKLFVFILYPSVGNNRGVSHYRILPISRDIGWPVQQLDYFRYKHVLTVDLTL